MNHKKILSFILALCFITLGLIFEHGEKEKAASPVNHKDRNYPHTAKKYSPTTGKKHVVKKGETISDVAKLHGVPIEKVEQANEDDKGGVKPGEALLIPKSPIKGSDKELLARLVHAEAKGEPYKGKVAVATVVLNRIQSEQFPDTVPAVIYQKNQFEPVMNGSIQKPAGKEAKKAVNEAIAIQGKTDEALYFYNPSISESKWMRQLTVIKVIGKHHFAI
ncbi:cell wall hydrolase [Peribacillus glennii]|uniref:LysM peptidoglycan-binding domain-containing protein n=1 Tax=Peribacillus glennii TaxID=2303991 RepID=A0A372LGE9_9BACI|nr:cell wall hydrolase [Peribacillus glennii]RFU65380.1 LysM peptidoglycan-binding domain-containing protein [Peribacillus glennii]